MLIWDEAAGSTASLRLSDWRTHSVSSVPAPNNHQTNHHSPASLQNLHRFMLSSAVFKEVEVKHLWVPLLASADEVNRALTSNRLIPHDDDSLIRLDLLLTPENITSHLLLEAETTRRCYWEEEESELRGVSGGEIRPLPSTLWPSSTRVNEQKEPEEHPGGDQTVCLWSVS